MICLFLLCVVLSNAQSIDATPWEIIENWGYKVENHLIPTEDGYFLNTQRIKGNGPVVYLQHGLLDSSCTWVMNLPKQSLGFMLADRGCDVWMGNQRGNRYSQQTANGTDFNWYFSIDQMSKYDDEAILKYITNQTNQEKISWIGHSRGTQQMFYGLSAYPEHADYMNLFIALAPVAWVGNAKVLLLKTIADIDVNDIFDKLGYHDFLQSAYGTEWFCIFCKECCGDLMGAIMGPGVNNATRFNQTRMEFYLHHFPAGTSSMEMAHYAQLVENDNIAMYDFGEKENIVKYGQPTPPLYDVTKIPSQLPIALFTGGEDYLADPIDVLRLISTMGSERFFLIHDEPNFNHADFVMGLEASIKIYPMIIDLVFKYSQK